MTPKYKRQKAMKKKEAYIATMRKINIKSIIKAERELLQTYTDNTDIVVGIKLMTDKVIEIAEKEEV